MSNLVSALDGAVAKGFCKVEDTGLRGMITLRGDLASDATAAALKSVLGCDVPEVRKVVFGEAGTVAWMSPDELLVLVSYDKAAETVAALESGLEGQHALVVNVSDARACFRLSDGNVREALAKVMPVDFAPDAFEAGDFRRSRLAQVPAAVWMTPQGDMEIMCFRSVAQYVFDVLATCSQPGSEVGLFA